jgi:hypothetical protein
MKIEATLYFKSDKDIFNEFDFITPNGNKPKIVYKDYKKESEFGISFTEGDLIHLAKEGDVYIDQPFIVKPEASQGNFKWRADVVINTPSIERIVHAILNKSVAITINKIDGIPNKI